MSYFGQLQRFDPVSGHVPDKPLSYLPVIAWRARALLKSRTSAQIDSVAKAIDFAIDCYFDELKQIEIARLREILNSPRRWKHEAPDVDRDYDYAVKFFDWDGGSRGNGRWIFNELELDIPTAENTSEVDALKECMNDWDDIGGEGFPDCKPYELFAVLSLWMLADSIEWLKPTKFNEDVDTLMASLDKALANSGGKLGHSNLSRLSSASVSAFTAMDAVCYAEHLREVARMEAVHSQKEVAHKEEERKRRSMLGEKLNIARHQKTNEAKGKAIEEWDKDQARFPSAEKAGLHLADWLELQGFTYEPRTVTGWIRAHAKKLGIKFR